MATTIPLKFEGKPRIGIKVARLIVEAYESSLRDEDKAGEMIDAAFYEGCAVAYEHVLKLIFPKWTQP